MSLCDKCGNDPMMTLTEQDAVAAAYDRDVAQVRVKQLEADLAAAKAERDSAKADWRDAAAEAHRLQTIQHEADRVGDNRHTLIETLRATIARAERAERDVEALNKFFLTGAEYSLDEVLRFLRGEGPDPQHKACEAKLADRDATIRKAWTAIALDNDTAAALEVLAPAPTPGPETKPPSRKNYIGEEVCEACCGYGHTCDWCHVSPCVSTCGGGPSSTCACQRQSGDAKGEAPR